MLSEWLCLNPHPHQKQIKSGKNSTSMNINKPFCLYFFFPFFFNCLYVIATAVDTNFQAILFFPSPSNFFINSGICQFRYHSELRAEKTTTKPNDDQPSTSLTLHFRPVNYLVIVIHIEQRKLCSASSTSCCIFLSHYLIRFKFTTFHLEICILSD